MYKELGATNFVLHAATEASDKDWRLCHDRTFYVATNLGHKFGDQQHSFEVWPIIAKSINKHVLGNVCSSGNSRTTG